MHCPTVIDRQGKHNRRIREGWGERDRKKGEGDRERRVREIEKRVREREKRVREREKG